MIPEGTSAEKPLGVSTLTKEHQLPVCDQEGYVPGTMLGNYLYLKDKSSGVEPGFLGVYVDKNFIEEVSEHILKDTSDPALLGLRMLLDNKQNNEDKIKAFKEWLRFFGTQGKSVQDLMELCVANQQVTRYLIKQNYSQLDSKGRVTIPVSRARNSNTVKKWTPGLLSGWVRTVVAKIYSFFRRRPSSEENRNALLECIGNDIAKRVYGMQCQEQSVIFGTYPNGRVKILTRGKWEFGLESLGEVHGGNQASGNYLVKEGGPPYLSDDSVKDLGENFALMLVQGDVDGIGSKAQNKFKKEGRLFGLDFGQVYRKRNTALDSLDDDFSLKQKGRKVLKNFSIFEDTPLREKMKGVHYIRKLLTGKNPSEDIMKGYGEEFRQKIEHMHQGGDVAVFDSYIRQLQVKVKATPALAAEYNALIKELELSRRHAIDASTSLVKKFEGRLSLTPKQLDILDAVEKLTSETSLISPNNTVYLNHMQTTKRVKWEMKVEGDQCVLTLQSPKDAKKAIERLRKYVQAHPSEKVTIDLVRGTIRFAQEDEDIESVAAVFSEARIQEHKHPKDVRKREQLKEGTEKAKPETEQRKAKIDATPQVGIETPSLAEVLPSLSRTITPTHPLPQQPQYESVAIQSTVSPPVAVPSIASRIELSVEAEPPGLRDSNRLKELQACFNEFKNEHLILVQPERQFTGAHPKLDPSSIKLSIRDYSIVVSRYDQKALEVGIRMLSDVFKVDPKDVMVTGLTTEQLTHFDRIKEEIANEKQPTPERTITTPAA